jgi:protein arginine N-methyltransferase 1
MSRVFDVHRWYLSDEIRMNAFRTAITQAVRTGDVVVDIGTGTGVLALMACAAGAARVYAIERDPFIEVARKIAHANGYGNRIEYLRGESASIEVPEPADVVLCDLIGPFAFDAGVFDVLADATARYLKPSGRTIPSEIALSIAPVESPDLRSMLTFWRGRPAGFDMSAARDYARKTSHHLTLAADALLTTPIRVGSYACARSTLPAIDAQATTHATRDGWIDAIAGWFEATLVPEVKITNAPGAPDRLARRNLLLPVTDPIPVTMGDEISVSVRVLVRDQIVQWKVECRNASGVYRAFTGSTFEGALISREDLAARQRTPLHR